MQEVGTAQHDYMISGSVAMSAYTVARYTHAIDVVIELSEHQMPGFATVLSDPARFYFYRPSAEVEIRRQGMFNVIQSDVRVQD